MRRSWVSPLSSARVLACAYHAPGLLALGKGARAGPEQPSVWGLGQPLRLVGQASPAEGDSPDPEGRDKLAASPHQKFDRFSLVIPGTSRLSRFIALAGPPRPAICAEMVPQGDSERPPPLCG